MFTRRAFLCATAAVAAVAVGEPRLPVHDRPEKKRVTIAAGGRAALCHLPLTIAGQLGYFKAEGLEVEIVDHPSDGRVLAAVMGGAADVCSIPYEDTIRWQARHQFLRAFVLQGRTPQVAVGISLRSLQDYRTAADLKGRRLGISAPGSTDELVLGLMLARAGVQASEVSFVEVGAAAGALTALRTGQIDAIGNTDPVMTLLEQKGDVRIVCDTRTLKGASELFGGPMPAGSLCAPVDFVQRHPNTCQALANAIVHGLKWLQTAGSGDILGTVPEAYLLGDRALYLSSFGKVRESISPDGLMPADGPRTAHRALAGFNALVRAGQIDLARTWTNDFARRAKERFKA